MMTRTQHILQEGLIAVAVLASAAGCQQKSLSASQQRFQMSADISLTRLTGRMSSAFTTARDATNGGRGVVQNGSTLYGAPYEQNQFGPDVFFSFNQSARGCLKMIAPILTSAGENPDENHKRVILTQLGRCLQNIVHTQSSMFAWMHRNQSPTGQDLTGYSRAFPWMGSVSGWTNSQQSQGLDPLLLLALLGGGDR